MRYKKLTVRCALALFFMAASTAASAAETCYFWIMYLAQPAPSEYKIVFEKKIITFKAPNHCGDMADDIKNKYVAFMKKSHPEYFRQYTVNGNAQQAEFNIRAQVRLNGSFQRPEHAKGALDSEIKDQQARYERDPTRNAPVILS